MEFIGSLVRAVGEVIATIGLGPFVVGIATLGGFVALDRLTKSGVAEKERQDNIAIKVLNDAAKERERHYEEREYERKQEVRERERLDKFEALIRELIVSFESLKVVINDLDQRLMLVMKMYGDKP